MWGRWSLAWAGNRFHVSCVSHYVIDYNWSHCSTPWNRAVLENLKAVKVFEELLAFYGTPIFIIVLISARHWSLSWGRIIQSIPLCLMFLSSILILSLHLPLAVPRVLCLSGTSIEICWISCVFHACYIHVCYHAPNFTALRTYGEQWKSRCSCLCSCIRPSLLSSLVHAVYSAPCYPTPSIFVLPLLLEKFSQPYKMINRVLSRTYLNSI